MFDKGQEHRMIRIILNNKAFEQDIRELLMAFYPGEKFVYDCDRTAENPVIFTVMGILSPDRSEYSLHLAEGDAVSCHGKAGRTAGTFDGNKAESGMDGFGPEAKGKAADLLTEAEEGFLAELKEEAAHQWEPISVDFEDRKETKNKIKRRLYVLLLLRTGRGLPWGALTGIRPVKLAMAKLAEGMGETETALYMQKTYFASAEKTALSIEIAQRERSLLAGVDCEHGYSLYVGIPFCPTTCLYCSFTSYPIGKWEGRVGLYLEALFRELDYVAERMAGKTLDTVYIGGGTPTSLSAADLDRLLTKLRSAFPMDKVREFTVEAGRPDSITREKLWVLKAHGITRISINPQTMNQETLNLIGRRHTVQEVKDTFAMAREEGFDNINMDLIVGLPEEGIREIKNTMEEIKALTPDSLTVHTLAVKRAARLNTRKELYKDLKIEGTREMIGLAAQAAREMRLLPYYLYRQKNMTGNFENVGYALPGKACLYNVLIMEEKQTIVGCGAGTTTKRLFSRENRIERCENVKEVAVYIEKNDEMIGRKRKLLE